MATAGSTTWARTIGRARWRAWSTAALMAVVAAAPAAALTAEVGTISGADGGLRLRASPGFDGDVVGTLWDGMDVGLRIDEADTVLDPDGATRWWPVSTDLGEGWVAGDYLEIAGWDTGTVTTGSAEAAPPTSTDPAEPAPAAQWDGPDLTAASAARVADADGVNLRAEPGTWGTVLDALGPGQTVRLRPGASTVWADGTRWWPVALDGTDGWVAGAYLEAAEEPAADAGDGPAESAQPAHDDGDSGFVGAQWATVATDDGTGLNLRADAAPDAERVGRAFETDTVRLLDGPTTDPLGNRWFLVSSRGVTGWAFGDYLVPGRDGESSPAAPGADPSPPSLSYPLSGFTMTQGFGCSPYPWFYAYNPAFGCNAHDALDLAAPWYTPLSAASSGVVEQAGWCDCGLGYYVKIDHGNGFKTLYGHMAEAPPVAPGQRVRKGDLIGYVGSTGNSTGAHVHFAAEQDGVKVDPLGFLP